MSWYMHGYDIKPRSIVQVDRPLMDISVRRNGKPTIPEAIHQMAMDEYNRQGFDQSHERMQERGGLSIFEVVMLLADAVTRAKP